MEEKEGTQATPQFDKRVLLLKSERRGERERLATM